MENPNEKFKNLFYALDICEKAWERACETGCKYDYLDENFPNHNIQNDCAACEHNKQIYGNRLTWMCNGICIINWGKVDKWALDFMDIQSYACEKAKYSPYKKYIEVWRNDIASIECRKIFANWVLQKIRESKKRYEILFRKF